MNWMPWFDYYDDSAKAVQAAGVLAKLKSVLGLAKEKRQTPLPENESCDPTKVVKIMPKRVGDQVREGTF